ncbi:MAG: hypothetical protein GF317_23460 [Candidatus Lokiarchaeota archaeon]|nr:hypothetical protein [Candidatus Lokiarchaeota archaeon]
MSILFCAISYAQIQTKVMSGGTKEIETSETLYWSGAIEAKTGKNIDVNIGLVIETVNTSNFQADLELQASADGQNWETQTSSSDYTFTQSSGVNSTIEYISDTSFPGKYVRLKVSATADAQTINLTPYINSKVD